MKRMGKWQYLVLDEGHKIKNGEPAAVSAQS